MAFDFCGGRLEAIFIGGIESRDDRTLRQRRWIDRQDFGDDHARPAFGTFGQKIDPARRDAIAGTVVGQGGGQRNAVSQGAAPDLQRTEQPGKLTALTHISSRDKRLWLVGSHSTMGGGRLQGTAAIF